jgi:hypothetical protein
MDQKSTTCMSTMGCTFSRFADLVESGHRGAIVCIGWGSLVYAPRDLPCGPWHGDGPQLPVEFARLSSGERITLVICRGVPRVPTFWSPLSVPDVRTARNRLGVREWEKARAAWIDKNVGYWERATRTSHGREADAIAAWATPREIAAVVWTNLPANWDGKDEAMPSADAVVDHLRALGGQSRDQAEAYVRRAPPQIDTPYRRRIAQELGWTYRAGPEEA